jgi:hypothetical protein
MKPRDSSMPATAAAPSASHFSLWLLGLEKAAPLLRMLVKLWLQSLHVAGKMAADTSSALGNSASTRLTATT